MRADSERWDRKFSAVQSSVDPAGEPELIQYFDTNRQRGVALELACGRGANALYLASLGYEVIAIDGSKVALSWCQRSAVEHQLRVYPVVADLDNCSLQTESFAVISVVRYLNRRLMLQLPALLHPGGLLFYKTFNRRYLEKNPKFNAEYVLNSGELAETFAELKWIAGHDGEFTSYLLAQKV